MQSQQDIKLKKREIIIGIYEEITGLGQRIQAHEVAFGHKYNPDQPRDPAGESGGGQWASDGGDGTNSTEEPKPLLMAANDGTPGDHERQNKQVRDIGNKLGLNNDQLDQLHDEVSGQNMGYHERCLVSN